MTNLIYGSTLIPYIAGVPVVAYYGGVPAYSFGAGPGELIVNGVKQAATLDGAQMTFFPSGILRTLHVDEATVTVQLKSGQIVEIPIPPELDLLANNIPLNAHFLIIYWSRSPFAGVNPPGATPRRPNWTNPNAQMLACVNYRDLDDLGLPPRNYSSATLENAYEHAFLRAQPVWGFVDALTRATRGKNRITVLNLAPGGFGLNYIFGLNGSVGYPMLALDSFAPRFASRCAAAGETPFHYLTVGAHSMGDADTDATTKEGYKAKWLAGDQKIHDKMVTGFETTAGAADGNRTTLGAPFRAPCLVEQSDIEEYVNGSLYNPSLEAILDLSDDPTNKITAMYSRAMYVWSDMLDGVTVNKPDNVHFSDAVFDFNMDLHGIIGDQFFATGTVPSVDFTQLQRSGDQLIYSFSGTAEHGATGLSLHGDSFPFLGLMTVVDDLHVVEESYAINTDNVVLTMPTGSLDGATEVKGICGYNEELSEYHGGSSAWLGAADSRRSYTGLRVKWNRYSVAGGHRFEMGPLVGRRRLLA
jgi:hypothetical protein